MPNKLAQMKLLHRISKMLMNRLSQISNKLKILEGSLIQLVLKDLDQECQQEEE